MIDASDNDDYKRSWLLLRLANSCVALGGSCVLDIHHRWHSPSKQSPTCLVLVTFHNLHWLYSTIKKLMGKNAK